MSLLLARSVTSGLTPNLVVAIAARRCRPALVVVTGPSDELVRIGVSEEMVIVSVPSEDVVVIVSPADIIGTLLTVEFVILCVAFDGIGVPVPPDRVQALAAFRDVHRAGRGVGQVDDISVVVPVDDVGARLAPEIITPGAPADEVVPTSSFYPIAATQAVEDFVR